MATFLTITILILSLTSDIVSIEFYDKLVLFVTYYTNGTKAPESVFDDKNPGTIAVKMILDDYMFYTLQLTRNIVKKASNYEEVLFNGREKRSINVESREYCRFHGIVKGISTSEVVITFCNGVSGIIYTNDAEYSLRPNGRHVDQAFISSADLPIQSRIEREKRENKYSFDRIMNVLELYIVNDLSQFESFWRNTEEVFNWALEVVSLTSWALMRYDLHVILVGMETWDQKLHEFNLTDKNLLSDWLEFKKTDLMPRLPKHDSVFLFTGPGNTTSKYFSKMFAMCDMHETGGIIIRTALLEESAAAMLHQIGRLLGLRKDADHSGPCACPVMTCIMAAQSTYERALTFSSCSSRELRKSLDKRTYPCLTTPVRVDTRAVCGNGIVEINEQCDCGNLNRAVCNYNCCNSDTCKFIGAAQCNAGKCCDISRCLIRAAKTVCRRSFGTCDVAEYCDGMQNECPMDEGVENGRKCEGDNYCFDGRCGGRTMACKTLWGPQATDGSSACYVNNLSQEKFGHCYADYSKPNPYKSCSDLNIYCGVLMCFAPDVDIIDIKVRPSRIHRLGSLRNACKALEYRFWKDDFNPGFVPDGSLCDIGKICYRRRCLHVTLMENIGRHFISLDGATNLKINTWFSILLIWFALLFCNSSH